jgi:chemotaxis protein CheD
MAEVECVLPDIYLQPGEAHLARKPSVIRTLLGSCVGVTFWSERIGAGALCHALLPRFPRDARVISAAEGLKYVDFAIYDLARSFDRLGANRKEIQVKVFGGADVLDLGPTGALRPTVGKQNCDAAIQVLRAEGFDVVASSLGGTTGRAIQFFTGTGEVRLRWLSQKALEESVSR